MDRLSLALVYINAQKRINYSAAERLFKIPRLTLMRRNTGKTTSREDAVAEYVQLLNKVQEDTLLRWIEELTHRSIPPTTQMVRNLAEEILGRSVGRNWAGQFVKRHKNRITSVYLNRIEKKRSRAASAVLFKNYFALLTNAIEKYHITAENIYNWDEKGFMIGRSAKKKRVLAKKAYKSGQIRNAAEDGSREFISLLACICADGTALPPACIYQGKSQDLQSSWFDDLEATDEAYFTSSERGWTNNALGMAWLKKFAKDTAKKAKNRRRLLILDGHSSHVNMEFIKYADANSIVVMVLPSHTTDRLQPLDISLFSPLSTAYTKHLDAYTTDGLGAVSMTKRMFWPLFRVAWKDSFTAKNIKSAFRKAGIWPLEPSMPLDALPPPPQTVATPTKLPVLAQATPRSCHGVRRLIKRTPGPARARIMERALLRNTTENDVLRHQIEGLKKALIAEKNRRKRGKALNLVGDPLTGEAQFFGTDEVLAARERVNSAEAQKTAAKAVKELKKQETTRLREEKKRLLEESRIQKQIARDEARALKEDQKATKSAAAKAKRELAVAKRVAAAAKRAEKTQKAKDAAAAKKNGAALPSPKNAAFNRVSKPRLKAKNTTSKEANELLDASRIDPADGEGLQDLAGLALAAARRRPEVRSRSGRAVALPARFAR